MAGFDSSMDDPEFNPYAAPKTRESLAAPAPEGGLWREGDVLVMRKDAKLPDRCVKCNAPADGYRLKRNLSWHHPAFYLVVLLNLLLYVVVALCVRKTATIEVGLCEEHRRRRSRTIATAWLFSLLGMVLFFVGIVNLGPQGNTDLWMIVWAVGLAMWVGFLFWGLLEAPPVTPLKIDKRFVWLKRVCPAFLDTLPEVPDVAPTPMS